MILKVCLFAFSVNYPVPFIPGLLVSLLLALPSIVDWSMQSLGFRRSSNRGRLFTGFLEGVGVSFMSLLDVSTLSRFLVVVGIGLGVILAGVLGRRFTAPTEAACRCS